MPKGPLEAYNSFYDCAHEEWQCTGCGVKMTREHIQLDSVLMRNAIKAGGYVITFCAECEKLMICPEEDESPVCKLCLQPPKIGR